jgi:hypothetical protein
MTNNKGEIKMDTTVCNMTTEERLKWEFENEKELHRQDVDSLIRTIEFLEERSGDTSYHI